MKSEDKRRFKELGGKIGFELAIIIFQKKLSERFFEGINLETCFQVYEKTFAGDRLRLILLKRTEEIVLDFQKLIKFYSSYFYRFNDIFRGVLLKKIKKSPIVEAPNLPSIYHSVYSEAKTLKDEELAGVMIEKIKEIMLANFEEWRKICSWLPKIAFPRMFILAETFREWEFIVIYDSEKPLGCKKSKITAISRMRRLSSTLSEKITVYEIEEDPILKQKDLDEISSMELSANEWVSILGAPNYDSKIKQIAVEKLKKVA